MKKLGELIDVKTEKALLEFQQNETRIYRKLLRKDSVAAFEYLKSSKASLQSLQQQLSNPGKLQRYIPYLDTLKTSFKFLEGKSSLLQGTVSSGLPITNSLENIGQLESSLQRSELVSAYLRDRRNAILRQLESFGLLKDLKKFNKQVYYYSQQIAEYRQILQDPKRLERTALTLITKTKMFEHFMQRNSQLAGLFRLPLDPPDPAAMQASLAGLQTRAQVNQLIQQQIAAGGPNAQAQVQQNFAAGQAQLAQARSRLSNFLQTNPSFGGAEEDIPDFKPNNQKTKNFWKRLELGTNMQSQRSNGWLPVTSDIGFSIGYKINDKNIIGIGTSYKMGWGANIQHIRFSSEGVGVRSFIDWKLKGSFYLSGGYEMNYRTAFDRVVELQSYNAWQQSGLLGISKNLSLQSKFFKQTKMQLLWDFLSYKDVPRINQSIIFRVGYSFN